MADSRKDLWAFECIEPVQLAAAQALQDIGVVIPHGETSDPCILKASGCFGLPVDWDYQETLPYCSATTDHEYSFQLPRVFVECVTFLMKHTDHEGLFRKAGSVSRQKSIRSSLEDGVSIPSDANVHDVAAILKQYLRMLPDPLLTKLLSPVFEACVTLVPKQDQVNGVLLACLLLPAPNLQCLYVLMSLLKAVSEQEGSLMSSSSLSIIMAPNLLHSSDEQLVLASGNTLIAQTTVIQKLIDNSELIGRVPCDVGVASAQYKGDFEALINSRKTLLSSCSGKAKKYRTSSISGMVLGLGSRLKQKGTSMFGGDIANGTRKRTNLKRKGGSHEDLLENITAGKKKMSPVSNVDEFRHSLRNRRCGYVSKPRRCPPTADQYPPPPEPSINTHFHMTPSVDFAKQAQLSQTYISSGSDAPDVYAELTNSCKKIKHFSSESDLAPSVLSSGKKLSPKNPAKFPASQSVSEFSMTKVNASPLQALPTFAPPKQITISPIVAQSDLLPARLDLVDHWLDSNPGAQFSFSLPTPVNPNLRMGKSDDMPHSPGSSVLSTLRCSKLDQAFLTTPFPATNSPNLMDKINSEMAQRNATSFPCGPGPPWYSSSYTPANIYRESLQPVNESYRKAVCRGSAFSSAQQSVSAENNRKSNCYEPANISIEGGNEDVDIPCPPLSLEFDISGSSNNSLTKSISESSLEHHQAQSSTSTRECTFSNTSNRTRPSSKFSSPSTCYKNKPTTKSPRSKLGIRMKATTTTRKKYDYSATLGIGESLMQAQANQLTKSASPSRKLYSHSACLGMTVLERESLKKASKQSRKTLPQVATESDHSNSLEHLCDLYSPKRKNESDSSYTLSLELRSPDSPAPALLKILETNVTQNKEERVRKTVTSNKTPRLSLSSLTRKALVDVRSNQQVLSQELMKNTDMKKPAITPFKRALKSPWLSRPSRTTGPEGTTEMSRAELYEVKRSGLKKEAVENASSRSSDEVSHIHEGVELKEWIL